MTFRPSLLTLFVCATALLRPTPASAQRTTASLQARPMPGATIGSSLQGTIQISDNLEQLMQQDYKLSPAQFAGNAIQVQVWQVTYQTAGRDVQTTDIVFQQRINANVSFQATGNNINYRIDGLPPFRNLAVVVFCNPLSSVAGVRVMGFPNDGRGYVQGHHYVSDAGRRLVSDRFARPGQQGVIYGIYSLVPGQTNPSAVDFKITSPLAKGNCPNCFDISDLDPSKLVQDVANAVTAVINGVSYVFDQAVDGVANLATLAINTVGQGIIQVGGYFINTTGLIFYSVGGTLVNLIVYGNLPKIRSLQDWEYNWANSMVFNGTLPPQSTILVFNFMNPDHRRCYTFPSLDGSQEYMNMGDAYDNPVTFTNAAYAHPGEVFIHEMTHVWQIGHYGAVNMVEKYFKDGGNGQTYDYQCSNGPGGYLNLEQMAQMTNFVYANLYYPPALFPNIPYHPLCGWELSWVQTNIRNTLFDTAAIYAAVAMKIYGAGLQQFLGDVSNGVAVGSPGNPQDKGGYFMPASANSGMLYFWSRMHQPLANWGEIRKKFLATGAERGPLGWPAIAPGLGLRNNGSFQQFERGWIYSTPQFGTYVITEPIFDAWAKQNWEKGPLGYPISDYIPDNSNTGNIKTEIVTAGGVQKFEHGIVTYTSRLGQVQVQVIMNDQLIKQRMANSTAPGNNGNTASPAQPLPGATKKLSVANRPNQ